MSRLSLLFLTLMFMFLTGCSTSRFVVMDAITQEPLPGVLVEGYRFQPREYAPADFAWGTIDVPPTGESGTTSSTSVLSIMPSENEFRFVLSKPGYQPGEVVVTSHCALVASPADDAGWKPVTGRSHVTRILPTQNYGTFPNGEKILVELYPTSQPTTEPAQ